MTGPDGLLHLVNAEAREIKALIWAFIYFFALLCSYYILRPLRDEMGIAGGVENLQWLFTGTFIAMLAVVPLFGWLTSRYPRKRFLPYVYYFFILNLLLFYVLFSTGFDHARVARAFFIWVSVFNLFVVSVFWSFMADLFHDEQARRLFGFIAAGGTAGAIAGSALTASLVQMFGTRNLLLVSAALLLAAIYCIRQLVAWHHSVQAARGSIPYQHTTEQPIGGSVLAGIRLVMQSPYLFGIALLMLLFTMLATFLYFQQAQIIRDAFMDPADRAAVFAGMDLAVNVLTLMVQVFLTGWLVRRLGLGGTLALIPLLLSAGLLLLSIAPTLAILIVVQVIRRAGNYAVMRPTREMLYVVLGREEKYKAKNFNDTVVYRAGDAVSAWIYAGLRSMGIGLSGIALIAAPIALLWAMLAWRLGKQQQEMAHKQC